MRAETGFVFKCLALFFCLLLSFHLSAFEDASALFEDLLTVDRINQELCTTFPIHYNNLLGVGYFNMPSARMNPEGTFGCGYSCTPPYRQYNLSFQLFNHLEIYGNYRIFSGIDDPVLSSTGFGEKSDKGANVKFALWHPEDSDYRLPGLAFGWEDFLGTKAFRSFYVVATQVVPKYDLELSFGYGAMRIHQWFGGMTWAPFTGCSNPYLKQLALAAEYDATDYRRSKHEPHPKGRTVKSRINYGVKYRLWDHLDLSLNRNKGEKLAFALAWNCNLGQTKGFFPKVDNPLPYRCAPDRCEGDDTALLTDALLEQGFQLHAVHRSYDCSGSCLLRLKVENMQWMFEADAKERLSDLLSGLIPDDVAETIVVVLHEALPVQEYRFRTEYLRAYRGRKMGLYELSILHPMHNSKSSSFIRHMPLCRFAVFPKTAFFFGSATGKFKGLFGVSIGVDGFVFNDWYYSVLLGVKLCSNLYNVQDVDRLNPSQIINVRTDSVNYLKRSDVTVDEAFLQKSWNLGGGHFGSVACGLFEPAYGGISCEYLYYPVNGCWAVGWEAAWLKKRAYTGVGFTDYVRKLDGFVPSWKKFHGNQGFLNFYYEWSPLQLDFSFKIGRFLAHDWGVRSECCRYYSSGVRVYVWYTRTSAKDYVNKQRYYDHGAGISLPLDIFYTYSCKQRWGYALSAWLRDVGAAVCAGIPLYSQIHAEREKR